VHALLSLHVVPFAFATGAGHPVAATHVPIVWHWSVVHVTAVPPVHVPDWHVSPLVHALLSLHVVPLATGEQVPTLPARLQAPQPPLHAVSQQTPFTQKPVAH
jgi:hypothetical protein